MVYWEKYETREDFLSGYSYVYRETVQIEVSVIKWLLLLNDFFNIIIASSKDKFVICDVKTQLFIFPNRHFYWSTFGEGYDSSAIKSQIKIDLFEQLT